MPTLGHCVSGVETQIQDYLLYLLRVAADRRQCPRVQTDGDLAIERRATHLVDILDYVREIEDDSAFVDGLLGQDQQLFDDRRPSETHVHGVTQVALCLCGRP